MATTFGAYLAASAKRGVSSVSTWLALVAPTTLFGIISGQNGFLTAALAIGGLRILGRRPILGGMALGALTFKPQLFILVPIALISARQWRCLVGVLLSIAVLTSGSIICFGWSPWWHWLSTLRSFTLLFESNRQQLVHLMPTVMAGLLDSGFSPPIARAIQTVISLCVAVHLWRIFGRRRHLGLAPDSLAAAAFKVSAFLVTPYAFVYDMPIVTSAVATAFDYRRRYGEWRAGEEMMLITALVLPILIYSGVLGGYPISPAVLLALLLYLPKPPSDAHGRDLQKGEVAS